MDNSVVFVIDDNASVRDAISTLLESVRLNAQAFRSIEEFLATKRTQAACCLVLDVKLPRMRGLEFQEMLKKSGVFIPVIFITADEDIPMTSRAMKAGAIEFLTKPFQKEEFLAAVHRGLSLQVRLREEQRAALLRSRGSNS
jgi:FixJ family two-component response regulator